MEKTIIVMILDFLKSKKGRIITTACLVAIGFLLWWLYPDLFKAWAPNIHRYIPVLVIIVVVIIVEGYIALAIISILVQDKKTSHNEILIGHILVLLGIPTFTSGIAFHVDGRLSEILTPTVPFPGWEVVIFIVGALLILHGIYWEPMLHWSKLYRVIDYIWYSGGIIAIVLAVTAFYKSQEVTYFQATIVDYHLAKRQIIVNLDELLSYCSDPTLIKSNERYGTGPYTQPSEMLCRLAKKERELWATDSLLNLNGKFDFRLLDPHLRHSTGNTEADVEFTLAFTQYLDSVWGKNGEWLCQLADAEWNDSGWSEIEKSAIEQASFATPLPSAQLELELPGIGGRTLRAVVRPSLGPPHRFGTDACALREKVLTRFRIHAGRTFVLIPESIAWLAGSWSMVLGLFIAVRLLKTTADIRGP